MEEEHKEARSTARVAFVGGGRVATALTLALPSPYVVMGALGTGPGRGRGFADRTGRPLFSAPDELLTAADIVLYTVPDRLLATLVAEHVAWFRPGQVVGHTSGVHSAAVLAPAADQGAARLALHPMQTISDPSRGRALFQGIVCTLEGDEEALAVGEDLVRAVGAEPWRVTAAAKPHLHAASVLASNALVALLAAAAESIAPFVPGTAEDPRAGALAALLPLAAGALENLRRQGLPAALTGPVERGDVGTVARNLAALGGEPRRIYRAFLPTLVALAKEKGSLSAAAGSEILDLSAEGEAP
jgi:predicted short-subunit dehydrogenase-like oxidoreductase (DUF2520 family)